MLDEEEIYNRGYRAGHNAGRAEHRTAEIRAICRALEEAWLHTPTETLEAMCWAVVLDEIPCDQADPMLWLREIRGKEPLK